VLSLLPTIPQIFTMQFGGNRRGYRVLRELDAQAASGA